jgi:hypothetical protein
MFPNMNKIIDRLSSAFRIETEIEEKENTVILHTHSYLGTKLLYSHSLDLSPLIDIAAARAEDAARAAKDHNKSS